MLRQAIPGQADHADCANADQINTVHTIAGSLTNTWLVWSASKLLTKYLLISFYILALACAYNQVPSTKVLSVAGFEWSKVPKHLMVELLIE